MLALAHNTSNSVAIISVHTIKSHHMQVNNLKSRMKDQILHSTLKQRTKKRANKHKNRTG